MLLSALLSLYTFICPMKNGERVEQPLSFFGDSKSVRFQSNHAEVYAVMEGEVIVVFDKGDFKSIAIHSKDSIVHSYRWLDEIRVEKCQYIQQGDIIGTAKPIDDSLFQIDVEIIKAQRPPNGGMLISVPKKELHFECD